jgi:serine phosphatase RsbU (regulator of sigma subunit)
VPLIAEHPFARAVRGDTVLHLHAHVEPDQFGPKDLPTSAAASGMHEGIVAPLRTVTFPEHGQVIGVLSLGLVEAGRTFDPDDVAFAEEIARRAAVAIARCRSYERERSVAERLQRALLPDAVPAVPGVDIAVRYRPSPGIDVGGDWYDVTPSATGMWVSVGDVVGHGVEAAALMGRVRSMLLALTVDEVRPERALARLESAVLASAPETFVTVVLAHVRPGSGEIELVLAGHPPVAVLGPDGVVTFAGRPQPPIGAAAGRGYVADRVPVPPGSLLVLFTDGLVERRGESIDVGLARLRAALEPWAGRREVESVADELLSTLAVGTGDDAAIVVLHVSEPG